MPSDCLCWKGPFSKCESNCGPPHPTPTLQHFHPIILFSVVLKPLPAYAKCSNYRRFANCFWIYKAFLSRMDLIERYISTYFSVLFGLFFFTAYDKKLFYKKKAGSELKRLKRRHWSVLTFKKNSLQPNAVCNCTQQHLCDWFVYSE